MPYGPIVPPLNLICTIGNPVSVFDGYWAEFPNETWEQNDLLNVAVDPQGCALEIRSVNPTPAAADWYGKTRLPVDLRDQPYGLSVDATGHGTMGFHFGQNVLASPFGIFQLAGPTLSMVVGSDYPNIFVQVDVTYSAEDHKHWRFRYDGSDLVLETAPDCGPWTERNRTTILEEPVNDLWLFVDRPGSVITPQAVVRFGPVRTGNP